MKKTMTIGGFIAALLSILGMVFKIQHLPGAGTMLILGFAFFSFYFVPVYGYNLFYEMSEKKSKILGGLGAFGLALIVLSILFKMQHWPGAGPLLILGWGFLCIIIYPFVMVLKILSSKSLKEKFLNITWYLSLSLILLGYAFKIMHLPGAGPLLFSGMWIISLGYLPLAYKMYNNDEHRKKLYTRFVLIPAFLVQISLVAMSVSKYILDSFVLVDDGINETVNHIGEKNNAFYKRFEKYNSEKTKLYFQKAEKTKELSGDLYEHIEKLKLYLMRACDRIPPEIPDDSIKLFFVDAKENYDIPSLILIGDPENPRDGAWSGKELKAKIAVYRQDILSMYQGEMKEITDKSIGLKTDDFGEINGTYETWETGYFEHVPLACIITMLSKFQSDVRYAESVTVEYLYNEAEKEMGKIMTTVFNPKTNQNDTIYFENPSGEK